MYNTPSNSFSGAWDDFLTSFGQNVTGQQPVTGGDASTGSTPASWGGVLGGVLGSVGDRLIDKYVFNEDPNVNVNQPGGAGGMIFVPQQGGSQTQAQADRERELQLMQQNANWKWAAAAAGALGLTFVLMQRRR